MNDEQMQPLLEVWLHDRDEAPRDANGGLARVMARLPEVHQRGRWLPFPLFRRKAQSPTATDTTDYRPSPIPATNGHAPTVIGRTQTMFSPVKAIAAGALIFAVGGVFLITQPFGQGGGVPGAEQGAELADPVEVTITAPEGTVEGEECTTTGDTPPMCTWTTTQQFSATDPRLSGTATIRVNEVNAGVIFEAYAIEVLNDEGAWVGTGRHVSSPVDATLLMLTGEGEYEGFSAVVFEDTSGSDEEAMKRGVIIEGGLPPFPEVRAE